MFKRVMIGLGALGVVAMWWAGAEAQCVQWRFLGGSNLCVAWRTKGVLCQVELTGQDCGLAGQNCNAQCTAVTDNSVAFCRSKAHPHRIRRTTCAQPLTFSGSVDRLRCTQRHDGDDDDNDDIGGRGDDRDEEQVCKATIELALPHCPCCGSGETCIDVTPIDMETTLTVSNNFYEPSIATIYPPPPQECGEFSPSCTIMADCTINPNRIKLNARRPYRCEISSGD